MGYDITAFPAESGRLIKEDGTIANIADTIDTKNNMVKVASMQKKWKDTFGGSSLDLTRWTVVQTGSGHTVTVGSNELTIATGTTINTETILMSKEYFTVPFRALFGFMISQKIANQEFYMEMVSVDPATGQPDGINKAGFRIAHGDNVGNAFAVYTVQAGGMADLTSAAASFSNAQTSYSIYEVEPFADECWFHSRQMDSTSGRNISAVRHQQIPDPNAYYAVRIRAKNLGTAPASTTSFKFQFVNVVDYAELTAEITAGRGNVAAGQSVGATITGGNVGITGSPTVQGATAHDSGITGNPVRIGGRAINANYVAVSTGDTADLITTLAGVLITKPYSIPELDWAYGSSTAITNTTDVVFKTAGAAGIKNFLTGLQFVNTSATGTVVVVKDGSTVVWAGYAQQNVPVSIQFPTPIRGTSATALNFAAITTGASIYVSAQGYQAP